MLSLAEREEISRGLARGASLRSIAASLGRAASTVSRELARNGGHEHYRAAASDRRAWDLALRPKQCKLATHRHLQSIVSGKLEQNWSPEQIAGQLYARAWRFQYSPGGHLPVGRNGIRRMRVARQ